MHKLLILLILFTLFSYEALAKTSDYKLSADAPVEINSDQMFFDRVKNIAYAKGNVEITQGDDLLFSDAAVFNRQTDIIYLTGNVVVKRPNGDIMFSDKARLVKSANKGIVINFKARMGKGTLLASRSAEVVDENIIVMEDMTISPCKVCASNYRSNMPLWQFRADKATMNRDEERVLYKNAKVDFLGVPIFYTPVFSSPSPGAKRKSGVLFPKFGFSSKSQGFGIGIPYYFNIAPNKDATITPVFTSKGGEQVFGQFRHKIKSGSYTLNGSIAYSTKVDKQGNEQKGKRQFSGHYDLNGAFDVQNSSHKGKISVKAKRIFDTAKTYLQKYKISSEQILTTDVSYNIHERRNSYIFRALDFQDLRDNHNNKTTPKALPSVDIHHEKKISTIKGAKLLTDINFLNLFRNQGTSYQRVSVSETLKAPFKLPYGQRLTSSLVLRGDLYSVQKRPIIVKDTLTTLNNNKEGVETRLYPEIRNEWSMPLYKRAYSNIFIIEPVIQLIASPRSTNLDKVGNEDSQDPEISASNLFSPNRYVGFDKIESGVRLNYGLRSNISFEKFKNINLVFGQSIRATKDSNFDKNSGLEGKRSDYVGKLAIQPDEHIFLSDNFRLQENNFSPLRNEINLEFLYKKWSLSIAHLWIDKTLLPINTNKYRQEVGISGNLNLHREWWLEASGSRRLGKKVINDQSKNVKAKVGISFLSDCLIGRLAVSRDYTNSKNLRPEDTYTFSILIPMY